MSTPIFLAFETLGDLQRLILRFLCIEIFQDNYVKPEGNLILTLRDTHGKILKVGDIIGYQYGTDMIIRDRPITDDMK